MVPFQATDRSHWPAGSFVAKLRLEQKSWSACRGFESVLRYHRYHPILVLRCSPGIGTTIDSRGADGRPIAWPKGRADPAHRRDLARHRHQPHLKELARPVRADVSDDKEKPRRVRPGFFAWSANSWQYKRRFRSRAVATLRPVLRAVRATLRPVFRAVRATLRPVLRAGRAVLRAVRAVLRPVLRSSARHLPACPADSARCLARGAFCRRHNFSPILF